MRPHIGLKRNCISEKTENRIPIVAPTPTGESSSAVRYGSACRGITGSTMPKPSRSMNTVRNTISSAPRDAGAAGSADGDSGGGDDEAGMRVPVRKEGRERSLLGCGEPRR